MGQGSRPILGFRAVPLMMILLQAGIAHVSLCAHEVGENQVRHQVTAEVGRRNVDVFLVVDLQAGFALRERQTIDADGDGQINAEEEKEYVRQLSRSISKEFSIHIAGVPLPTLPLFHPKLDLQGDRGVEASPLRIELSFFTRTPARLPGPILIRGGIRRWQPAVHSVRARAREGMEAWALPSLPSANEEEPTTYRIWGQPQTDW